MLQVTLMDKVKKKIEVLKLVDEYIIEEKLKNGYEIICIVDMEELKNKMKQFWTDISKLFWYNKYNHYFAYEFRLSYKIGLLHAGICKCKRKRWGKNVFRTYIAGSNPATCFLFIITPIKRLSCKCKWITFNMIDVFYLDLDFRIVLDRWLI